MAYFPTLRDSLITKEAEDLEPLIAKSDILAISVYALDPEASANLNRASTGSAEGGYLVNKEGFIQFPFLGQVKATGLTKKELAASIVQGLTTRKLLLDPIVTIRLSNFHVTVLGEVGRPSVFTVPSEQINILEAIGMAGDVSLTGKKENVLLIRQEGGVKITRRLNLMSNDLLTSPYFYLRSNDIVYVEPNERKIKAAEGRQSILPIIFSSISVAFLILDRLIK